MITPAIVTTPGGIIYKDNSVLFAGRVRGGLDFQDEDSYCQGSLHDDINVEDDTFFFCHNYRLAFSTGTRVFGRGQSGGIGSGFKRFRMNQGASANTYQIRDTIDGASNYFRTVNIPGDINSGNFLWGYNIYDSRSKYDFFLYEYATKQFYSVTNQNATSTSPEDIGSEGIRVGLAEDGPSFPSFKGKIYQVGILGRNISYSEFQEWALSEGQAFPPNPDFKIWYNFLKKEGNTIQGKGSGANTLTLIDFANTTKGNANNRWVDAYKFEPK